MPAAGVLLAAAKEVCVISNKAPLESKVENDFVKGVKTLAALYHIDLKCRKMNGLGYRSWPDRLVLGPKKFLWWVEFKRPAGKGTKAGVLSQGQEDLFEELEHLGFTVYVHDDAQKALQDLEHDLIAHGVLK